MKTLTEYTDLFRATAPEREASPCSLSPTRGKKFGTGPGAKSPLLKAPLRVDRTYYAPRIAFSQMDELSTEGCSQASSPSRHKMFAGARNGKDIYSPPVTFLSSRSNRLFFLLKIRTFPSRSRFCNGKNFSRVFLSSPERFPHFCRTFLLFPETRMTGPSLLSF